jgi:type I restriction enzyme S subunit
MDEWNSVVLRDALVLNPVERLPAGTSAPYIDMAKVMPWNRWHGAPILRKASSGSRFKDGDTLLARITPCLENGKTAQVRNLGNGVIGWGSTEFIVLRARSGVTDENFVYHIAREPEFREYAIKQMTGSSGRQRVQLDALANFVVNLPPLAEQRAIAGVLGALDDKIESNRRIVKQIELVLLAHSNSLSTLPRVALHEVSKSYRRPVNPLVLGDEWVDHFSLPAFDVAAMPERCQASSIMSGKFGIETTSVLISRLNPDTPRVWCASVREVPAMCSSEFLVLEPLKKSSVGALWLAAVHPSLREQMVQRATGTSFSHQRIKSDDALSVEVPDIRMIDEQTRGECDELIAMVGKQRGETEYLSRLRDVLLPELLSGRLRVKDAESMMESV